MVWYIANGVLYKLDYGSHPNSSIEFIDSELCITYYNQVQYGTIQVSSQLQQSHGIKTESTHFHATMTALMEHNGSL